jgi:hypothetical protein
VNEAAAVLDQFAEIEWMRLDSISAKYDQQLKTAYLQTVAQRQPANSLKIRNVLTDCVVETAVRTAPVYGMVFNPNAPVYRSLIDTLTDRYMDRVMNDEDARNQVRDVLPTGLSLSDRRNRLDVFGLDGKSAVRVERMRQEGRPEPLVQAARISLVAQRGNLLALTEINRTINYTLETLWIENLRGIRKAETSEWFYERNGSASKISSLAGIPKRAKKEIVTRKDNRTCDYCEPLDGKTARLGTEFNTEYGMFIAPPFHPRCRCFMIVRV